MASFRTTPETRFDSFNVYTTSYKKIGDHEIEVGILIPKNITPGKHPLLVKFHGGSLVTGTALYPDWFASYFVPFIQRNSAIVVLPNYRLVPEHSGNDILEDLADFWKWYNADLATFIASKEPAITLDFDHLLVSGESAGGLLSAQSALTTPKGFIKAMLLQYPMTNYVRPVPGAAFDAWGPPPKPEIIDKHIASVVPGTVVSSCTPPGRLTLGLALGLYGRWNEFYGTGKHLLPIDAVEDATHFPPTFIIHGEHDRAVSVEDSRAFKQKVERRLGKEVGDNVRLVTPNGDHGFDVGFIEDDVPWLKEGLKWVEKEWLA